MQLCIGKNSKFNNIEKALEYIKANAAAINEDVEIIFKDEKVILTEPIKIDTCYSFMITFKSENKTVISGGISIEGWKKVRGKDYYVADAKLKPFRQLYVNGKRAQRARSKVLFGGRHYVKGDFSDTDGFVAEDNLLKYPKKATELEVVWERQEWRHFRHRVEKAYINDEGKLIIMMRQPYYAYGLYMDSPSQQTFLPTIHQMKYLENALEFLTEPGEWYYDKTKEKLYYMPREGEAVNSLEVIASQLEYAVIAEGTKDELVGNISFENLAFMHFTWNYVTEYGFAPLQASSLNGYAGFQNAEKVKYVDGNLTFKYAKSVKFKNCLFTHLGACAIRAETGVDGFDITGCDFYDISEGAIQLGRFEEYILADDERCRLVHNVKICDNLITDVGCEYYSAAAIIGYAVNNAEISNNEIYDVPYTAISMGWGWGSPTNTYGNIKINRNKIHDFTKVLRDGGAIYLLGPQYGTEIYENYIYNQINEFAALYTDNGTQDVVAKRNVFINVDISAFPYEPKIERVRFTNNWMDNYTVVNYATDSTVTDNYYFERDYIPCEAADIISNSGRKTKCETDGGKYYKIKSYFNVEKTHAVDVDAESRNCECNVMMLDTGKPQEIKALLLSLNRHGTDKIYDLFISDDAEKFTFVNRTQAAGDTVTLTNLNKAKGRYIAVMVEAAGKIYHGMIPIKDIRFL